MKKIKNYSILEILNETASSIVYRARRDDDETAYVIKKLKKNRSSQIDIARFRQEYDIIRSIDDEGVIKVYDCIDLDDEIALVLEDFSGIQLKSLIRSAHLEIVPFLKMAISLASTLGNLHMKNIIHKDIKPQNILINLEKNLIKISDFGISSVITHDNEEIYDPNVIEGTLIYMSPEQTGRMNRPVDYRSDLYSLGVTFYEMLTGEAPFIFQDPMEVIYAHIARKPEPPCLRDKSIPETISDIIMKLLLKNAEERYQNAFGLMADLNECLSQYIKTGFIENFDLAGSDTSITFNIPQKFFGRENEIRMIMEAFERVCQNGKNEITLVKGNPGIGKSALINEINKPMAGRKGYLISGKYDQFRKDVPYSAVIQAFAGLAQQILTENRERISEWKNLLMGCLGPNGRIITDIIPAMELIIGKQPPVPVLGPDESNNRFILVFNNFVRIFAREEHPLVIFLDDLQWADLASLALIRNILIDQELRYIFFIGSYRDNDVFAAHPLMLMIDEIRKENIGLNIISLEPLDTTAVNQLLSNFLRSDEDITMLLAELIHKKTIGNPFFINQFLKTLYDEKIITLAPVDQLHREKGSRVGWSWSIEKIAAMRVTDNVVELMADQISRLPAQSRDSLKIAACIGSWFDLVTLSMIQNISIDNALSYLSSAINEGLIVPQGQKYTFYHDRIQEAAYSLIPQLEKSMMHTRIGRLLLQKTEKNELNEKILYIVNQLNEGRNLLYTEDERLELAKLNLQAGIKAKMSSAYRSALHYIKTGIELINKPNHEDGGAIKNDENYCWKKWYDFSLSLYSEAAEAAYLCTEFSELNIYADAVLANSKDIFDKARIYESLIHKFIAQNKLLDAISVGMDSLKFFNIKFPDKPKTIHLLASLIKIRFSLIGRSTNEIYNQPVIKASKILLALRLLNGISSSVYWGKPELFPLTVFKFVNLSLKYGNNPYSPYAYAGYGLILCSIGNIEDGYAFGRMSQRLLDKLDVQDQKARTGLTFNVFIRHWKEHVNKTLSGCLEGYKAALETGDLEFAFHHSMSYCAYGYLIGKEISNHRRETESYINLAASLKQNSQLHILCMYNQIMINLQSENDPYNLKGPIYDEEEMLQKHIAAADQTAISAYYLNKSILYYLFNEYENALSYTNICEKNLSSMVGQLGTALFYFYDSLICIALCDSASGREKARFMKKARKNLKKLKKWAMHAPMNHQHKADLVLAEIARIKGDYLQAEIQYDLSIYGAHENEYTNEEALACERAAFFYMDRGLSKIAATYMTDALRCYTKWGALAKVNQLEEKYPDFIQESFSVRRIMNDADSTLSSGSTTNSLDITTVIKASQVLASEIHLDRLLKKMLGFAMENAGAGRGMMIMEKDGKFFVEAEGTAGGKIKVLQSVLIEDCAPSENSGVSDCKIPYSIINYIIRTSQNLVLDDASLNGAFTTDPYIMKNKIRSLLCAPITEKGKIAGILYLENNLSSGAFTPERVELLAVLSAQAAISLENARLISVETEKAAMDREIEMAKNIQQSLLPSSVPDIKNAHIAFKYAPMMGVGGDFVNIKYLPDAEKLGLFICDVSGHGVPAAMTASIISAALDFYWEDFIDDPSIIFTKMQNFLTGKLGGNFFTACLCTIDLKNGMLTVSSAGHPKLILLRKNGNAGMSTGSGRLITDFISSNSINEIITLAKGDRILLYTDGITEASNSDREMLGTNDKHYCSLIKELSDISNSPEALCDMIYRTVIDFTKSVNLQDDVTMLVCDFGDKEI